MAFYRLYYFDTQDRIFDLVERQFISDEAAIASAEQIFMPGECARVELWDRSRLVFQYRKQLHSFVTQ